MTTLKEKIVEKNTWDHLACPNCGKLYQLADREHDRIRPPVECERCNCPTSIPDARQWMDSRADTEHDNAITMMGKKLRGDIDLPIPSVDLEAIKTDIRESLGVEIKAMIAEGMESILAAVVESKPEPKEKK